jgi:hypothetical protein
VPYDAVHENVIGNGLTGIEADEYFYHDEERD